MPPALSRREPGPWQFTQIHLPKDFCKNTDSAPDETLTVQVDEIFALQIFNTRQRGPEQ
jgi:hypothetical protein